MDCCYCRQPLKDPKILCCSRLCKSCLQTHFEATVKDDFIGCIICYAKIKIPDPYRPREEWSSQYLTDTFLERMIAAGEQIQKEHNCFVCESSRGAVTPPTQYCFSCDTYYCDGCNELHLQLRGLQGHSIVPIAQLQTKDLMTKRRLYCSTHKDKLLDTLLQISCNEKDATAESHDWPQGEQSYSHLSQWKYTTQVGAQDFHVGHVICSSCASEQHKACKSMPVAKAAKEVNDKLNKVRNKIEAVLDLQEQKSEVLKERCQKVSGQKEAKINEIEAAFSKIQTALDERKQFLIEQVQESSEKNVRGIESLSHQSVTYLQAMKDVHSLLSWLEECGTEQDVVTSGDVIINQYNHLYNLSSNPSNNDLSVFKSNIHIEDTVITTFIQLVNMIGTDTEGHIIAFKTKQTPMRMPEDVHEPVIKDILLLEDNSLMVTDNKNKCVKMASITDAGDPRLVRLDLKTQPRGITKLQVNVMAVTGHECLYIITKTEDLHLQSTVRTRKDYWSLVALSPIKLALTCKFPPSVDIIDITGRKLRTIERDTNGEAFFKVPQYISTLYDKILVSDRDGKTLNCLNQEGESIFTFRGSAKQELEQPKGVCASKSGRVFMVENDEVWLISSNGKMVNKMILGVPGVRAIHEENGTLVVSVDGKGVVYYKIIDMSNALSRCGLDGENSTDTLSRSAPTIDEHTKKILAL